MSIDGPLYTYRTTNKPWTTIMYEQVPVSYRIKQYNINREFLHILFRSNVIYVQLLGEVLRWPTPCVTKIDHFLRVSRYIDFCNTQCIHSSFFIDRFAIKWLTAKLMCPRIHQRSTISIQQNPERFQRILFAICVIRMSYVYYSVSHIEFRR